MATARAAELGAMSKQSGSSYQGDFFRSPHTALDALPQALLDLQPDSPHFDRVLFRHTQVGWFACLLACSASIIACSVRVLFGDAYF